MHGTVLAIDPGNKESAYVLYNGQAPIAFAKVANADMLAIVADGAAGEVVIEQVAAMGMAVGEEVFETVYWSGRFAQASPRPVHRLKRHAVKMHMCHNMRAKDGNIRQAIIDRFGGSDAIGRKKTPGPLYGISADVWQALALAITFAETSR